MPVLQSGNGPAFKILLANKKVDQFNLINSGKPRIGRFIRLKDFSSGDRELAHFLQGRLVDFGLNGSKNGDRFKFDDVGMGTTGFKILEGIRREYKYQYIYIYPNDVDYDTSIKTA